MRLAQQAFQFLLSLGGKCPSVDDGDMMAQLYGLEPEEHDCSGSPKIHPRTCHACRDEFFVSDEMVSLVEPDHPMNICGICTAKIAAIDESEPLPPEMDAWADKVCDAVLGGAHG